MNAIQVGNDLAELSEDVFPDQVRGRLLPVGATRRTEGLSLFRRRVLNFGFRVSGFEFWVWGLGFRFLGFGFRVTGSDFRVWCFVLWVSGSDFPVWCFGFRVEGLSHTTY